MAGGEPSLVVLIAAVTGLLTALTLFGGFVLALLTSLRQSGRDRELHSIKMLVDGVSVELKASAKGQADAETALAQKTGFDAGVKSERADPMSPAGS